MSNNCSDIRFNTLRALDQHQTIPVDFGPGWRICWKSFFLDDKVLFTQSCKEFTRSAFFRSGNMYDRCEVFLSDLIFIIKKWALFNVSMPSVDVRALSFFNVWSCKNRKLAEIYDSHYTHLVLQLWPLQCRLYHPNDRLIDIYFSHAIPL